MKNETPIQTCIRHLKQHVEKYKDKAQAAKGVSEYSVYKECQHDLEDTLSELKKIDKAKK